MIAIVAAPSLVRTSVARAGLRPNRGMLARPMLSCAHVANARRSLIVKAETSTESPVDVDALLKDLQEKWDRVENKTSLAVYGAGGVMLLWLTGTVVGALNHVPLLPKLFELVGLGYTAWFAYRYLLFKSSREELLEDVEALKKRISGSS